MGVSVVVFWVLMMQIWVLLMLLVGVSAVVACE